MTSPVFDPDLYHRTGEVAPLPPPPRLPAVLRELVPCYTCLLPTARPPAGMPPRCDACAALIAAAAQRGRP